VSVALRTEASTADLPRSVVEEGRDRGDLDGISTVPAAYDDYV